MSMECLQSSAVTWPNAVYCSVDLASQRGYLHHGNHLDSLFLCTFWRHTRDETQFYSVGYRSFMQERLHRQQSSQETLGECVLYFGCRRSDQDYLYGPQLEQWQQQGSLTLFTAFSRQQVC